MDSRLDGTVIAWGGNEYGAASVPPGLDGVIAISAAASHNLALKSDGTVSAWGRNRDGENDVPEGLSGVVALAAGEYHNLAIVVDPVLHTHHTGNVLRLSWSQSATGYQLESTDDLSNPGSWAVENSVPEVVDGQFSVNTELSAGSRFYRLRKP
jgi:hypothetical protein